MSHFAMHIGGIYVSFANKKDCFSIISLLNLVFDLIPMVLKDLVIENGFLVYNHMDKLILTRQFGTQDFPEQVSGRNMNGITSIWSITHICKVL